ncbi:MAG TPA: DNA repair protein RadC [Vicinamibacterales bacterium]|jgi:DNA repair protein RadC
MRELAAHDRPREKLLHAGAGALGDNELLAIVLGSAGSRAGVLTVANAVLQESGGLHDLARASAADLRRVHGIGEARAAQVLAAIELGRRTLLRGAAARVQILRAQDAVIYLMPQFGSRGVEHFGVLLLDTRHRVMRTVVVSMGTLDTSLVHPREVFREAVAGSAAALVLFHNHPSGDPTPSAEDVELTGRLAMAGRLVGIDVMDHVILGDGRYYSFKEAGRL